MKTLRIALFTAFLWTIPHLTAQNAVNISTGLSMNNWLTTLDGTKPYENKYIDDGTLTSFFVSVPIEFDVSKRWTIQIEPSLVRKGDIVIYSITAGSVTQVDCRFKVTYIELPALAKFSFRQSKQGFYLLLGPSVACGLNIKLKQPFLDFSFNKHTRPIIDKTLSFEAEHYPRLDIAINTGIGFKFGKKGFNIRYSLGLINLGLNNVGSAKYYNQGIQFAYSYTLGENR